MKKRNRTARQKSKDVPRRLTSQIVARMAAFVIHAYRARRDAKYLSEFDDRLLADLGISRSEIEGVVHWKQPATHSSTLSENKRRDATHLRAAQEQPAPHPRDGKRITAEGALGRHRLGHPEPGSPR